MENTRLIPRQTRLQKSENNSEVLKNKSAMAGRPDALNDLKTLPSESWRMAGTRIVSRPGRAA